MTEHLVFDLIDVLILRTERDQRLTEKSIITTVIHYSQVVATVLYITLAENAIWLKTDFKIWASGHILQ